jgi:hypothetical protein
MYFFPEKIKNTIHKYPLHTHFTFIYNNTHIEVYAYGPNNIKKLLTHVVPIIADQSNHYITLYYYPTRFRKTLHIRDKTIAPINVNSGYTQHGNTIIVFRREEHEKVIIHELIHALDIDDCSRYFDYWMTAGERMFCANNRYFEAYTEYIATMIWLDYKNIDIKKQLEHNERVIEYLNYYMSVHNIIDPCYLPGNVFSYYYLKHALMKKQPKLDKINEKRIDELLQMMKKHRFTKKKIIANKFSMMMTVSY